MRYRSESKAERDRKVIRDWKKGILCKTIEHTYNIAHATLYLILKRNGVDADSPGNKISQLELFD